MAKEKVPNVRVVVNDGYLRHVRVHITASTKHEPHNAKNGIGRDGFEMVTETEERLRRGLIRAIQAYFESALGRESKYFDMDDYGHDKSTKDGLLYVSIEPDRTFFPSAMSLPIALLEKIERKFGAESEQARVAKGWLQYIVDMRILIASMNTMLETSTMAEFYDKIREQREMLYNQGE